VKLITRKINITGLSCLLMLFIFASCGVLKPKGKRMNIDGTYKSDITSVELRVSASETAEIIVEAIDADDKERLETVEARYNGELLTFMVKTPSTGANVKFRFEIATGEPLSDGLIIDGSKQTKVSYRKK